MFIPLKKVDWNWPRDNTNINIEKMPMGIWFVYYKKKSCSGTHSLDFFIDMHIQLTYDLEFLGQQHHF